MVKTSFKDWTRCSVWLWSAPRVGIIINCPQKDLFHDPCDVIIISWMATISQRLDSDLVRLSNCWPYCSESPITDFDPQLNPLKYCLINLCKKVSRWMDGCNTWFCECYAHSKMDKVKREETTITMKERKNYVLQQFKLIRPLHLSLKNFSLFPTMVTIFVYF